MTETANKRAAYLLRQYLAETNDDAQFELFSSDVLKLPVSKIKIYDVKARYIVCQNQI